ncbi:hypothetical protein ACOJBM_29405 [Rhizobium beringeri]
MASYPVFWSSFPLNTGGRRAAFYCIHDHRLMMGGRGLDELPAIRDDAVTNHPRVDRHAEGIGVEGVNAAPIVEAELRGKNIIGYGSTVLVWLAGERQRDEHGADIQVVVWEGRSDCRIVGHLVDVSGATSPLGVAVEAWKDEELGASWESRHGSLDVTQDSVP